MVNGRVFPVFVALSGSTDPDDPYYISSAYDETRGELRAGGDSIEEAVDACAARVGA